MTPRPLIESLPLAVKAATARDWPIRKAIFRILNPHLELREV